MGASDGDGDLDVVVATLTQVDAAHVTAALGRLLEDVDVEPVVVSAPLFWTRVRSARGMPAAGLIRALECGCIGVRYVTPVREGSDELAPPMTWPPSAARRIRKWRVRDERSCVELEDAGCWFLGENGIAVNRAICGTGAGTRLAVIDNDAGATDRLELDAVDLVGVLSVPEGSRHCAYLSAWAVGTRDAGFCGVAPDATLRHYYIPKPGRDVVSLALAIVRAVDDGADVVLCATHVEGNWSPLLDDALELAIRGGRNGLGTAVVMPAGRECSSPSGAVHARLSLGFGDPASDPRLFCVGPSSATGGWFLYRDRRGRYRPFANRGPAVRWLAPGDDLADPFRPGELAHAESSGAAAVAAGALLLVLGKNPDLTVSELAHLVTRTVTPLPGDRSDRRGPTVSAELEPTRVDRDGHNAKHGHGRIHATRACLVACDPVAGALVAMGEDSAARLWQLSTLSDGWYSPEFARWAAKMCLTRSELTQALISLTRHVRLLAPDPKRAEAHAVGATIRQIAVLLRALLAFRISAAAEVDAELEALARAALASARVPELRAATAQYLGELAQRLWPVAARATQARTNLAAS